MKLIKKTGIFNPDGEIILHPGISVYEKVILSGSHGIVWATYNQRQAEVLSNALLAQNITSAIGEVELEDQILLLIKIQNINDIPEAMDFIWRKDGGMRLKPDWTYPKGEVNKSFEVWLGA